MTIFKIVAIGIVAAILIVFLKEQKKEYAILLSIVAGVMLLLLTLTKLEPIISVIQKLSLKIPIDTSYIVLILKVIGISYLIEFGKDICKDAGENAIANKIEIAGKVIIVSISIPVVTAVLETITQFV
jgi:stage III sporulation protein AD